ncbi:SMC-Scp complex subunit ScpB [Pseudoxanthomonas suwonensis]|uniref:SMC-Scp complex subunit ScpB n=1 Tax=Pseudoxanthomonas suwonensis TaxID=314722 RepID=UPI0004659FD8|nr:SMC-Scp complex subunit ScpB [Pseudoxanthomonas suwonensis]
MDQALINRIVEAALLAANQPLALAQLHGLFPEDDPAPLGSVEAALEHLREACADRGIELVEVASGFRFQVKADVHPWVARLWTERKTRYTRATLETLALIAYRQPITRGEIEQVRGVAVSSNIIQALEEREWIRVVGHRDVPGRPALYGTTKAFLDYFGLKRLDELPPLSELKDIGELEPQLPLDPDAAPAPAGVANDDAPAGPGEAANDAPAGEGADDATSAAADETAGDTGSDTTEDPQDGDTAASDKEPAGDSAGDDEQEEPADADDGDAGEPASTPPEAEQAEGPATQAGDETSGRSTN